MSKMISQNTFDDVVKENIEMGMDPIEAKQETIKEFEAQGINLANIILNLDINAETGKPILNELIDDLKLQAEKLSDKQKLFEILAALREECDKSLPHRVLAGKYGAHEILLGLLDTQINAASSEANNEVIENLLQTMNSLMNMQPDLFDAKALEITLKLLQSESENIRRLTLQWLQKATVKHETNRTNLVNAGIIEVLKSMVVEKRFGLLRDILKVLRHLVLDDDIRLEFGNAHENARQIASALLIDLINLLDVCDNVDILADLILTIGTLTVRQEFCTTIETSGGLQYVVNIMNANKDNVRLNNESLKLLRALGGSDPLKISIVRKGGAAIIKDLMETHKDNENLVASALACVSILCLRVKDNSSAFFELGAAATIAECLQLHPRSKTVQRNGAWAIRNMVSRSRDQCDTWLSYGLENILNTAMSEHTSVAQDIKAALRDLGCKVDLKEEWTGVAEKKIF